VRRLVSISVLAALLVGCSSTVPGGKKVTTPTPETVVGPLPTLGPKGNPAAGRPIFISTGCGACHTFRPAGTTGRVGPNLNNLAASAQHANQGTLAQFTRASIVDPGAYVAPGFPAGVMPTTYGQQLKPQQLADLVSFLVQGP
jgi:mono/diheme cytochrome c family protein